MSHECRCWRVIFFTVPNDEGERVMNVMAYVVAPSMSKIYDVVSSLLPHLKDMQFDVAEEIVPVRGCDLFSVRIGLPPARRSFCVSAPMESAVLPALKEVFRDDDQAFAYLEEGVVEIKRVDLSKGGVW